MKRKPAQTNRPACSLCGEDTLPVTTCEGGYVCEPCSERLRQGRDNTTRAAKTLQRSLHGRAEKSRIEFAGGVADDLLEYDIASSEMMAAEAFEPRTAVAMVHGGEVLPRHDVQLVNTLAAVGVVALDASNHRLELITAHGTDVAALALDASDTVQAGNSLEKMLAHQSAVLHDNAMRYVSKANLEQDPMHSVRMMNLGVRLMETFQKSLLTLKRLRGTGEQRITIQHVNVTGGGQAVIGQVKTGGNQNEQ
jgi:hypothetical protein